MAAVEEILGAAHAAVEKSRARAREAHEAIKRRADEVAALKREARLGEDKFEKLIEDSEARLKSIVFYEGKLKEGCILVSVHVDDNAWRGRAKEILRAHGATDVTTVGEASNPRSPVQVSPRT